MEVVWHQDICSEPRAVASPSFAELPQGQMNFWSGEKRAALRRASCDEVDRKARIDPIQPTEPFRHAAFVAAVCDRRQDFSEAAFRRSQTAATPGVAIAP